jgi:hypothetical protein
VEVATKLGVHHIVRSPKNRGLARGFIAGTEASLLAGADIIVNTDADNQYCAQDIAKLIAPIQEGRAEFVIGERPIMQIRRFSLLKRLLQRLGSWVVRLASNTRIPDTTSGFRAMSRSAAMQLRVFGEYTYTLETIIQAGHKGLAVVSVPVRINPDLRPSRLVRSIPAYLWHSIATIVRIFITYRPLRFFACLATLSLGLGFALGVRFLYFWFTDGGRGHVQSLILAGALMVIGFMLFVVGVLADLISVNRRLLEDIRTQLWRIER